MPPHARPDIESPAERWDANLESLRILKDIEREGRSATPPEKESIKDFSGFGDSSFNSAFHFTEDYDKYREGGQGLQFTRDPWARRGDELRAMLTPEEYKSIRESRTTAFFTSPHIVKAMWSGLEQMGLGDLDKIRVLEPSAGSGRFIEEQPEALRKRSEWTAVEKDALTAKILKNAYGGDVRVLHSGLEEAPLPDDGFDLAISNVPFGSQGVHDPDYLRAGKAHLTRSLHNYFFAKGLDLVRTGGIVAFVTSHHMMDSPKAKGVRQTLANEADLLGAVRLPKGAFPDTKVVTDIVYLRKRLPGEPDGDRTWVESEKVPIPFEDGGQWDDPVEHPVNRYFIENPKQVLGRQVTGRHGMRGSNEYTVEVDRNRPVEKELVGATKGMLSRAPNIPASKWKHAQQMRAVDLKTLPRKVAPARQLTANDEVVHKSLQKVRDLARGQVNLESADTSDKDIEANRQKLQQAYLTHVKQHGALNSPLGYALMIEDPDRALLFALENYEKASDCWQPAGILGDRAISGAAGAVPQLAGVQDALDYHMQKAARLDFKEIGELVGQDEQEVRDSLSQMGRVYQDPKGGWVTSEEYLSGNVREKLEKAKSAAEADPTYRANIEALEDVQPAWIGSEDIVVPMGSPWVPAHYVNQWIGERLGIGSRGRGYGNDGDGQYFAYDPDSGRWRQRWQFPKGYRTNDANLEWGTPKVAAQKIIEKMITGGSLQIGDSMSAEDVRFAQERARSLQEDWEEWLWSDQARAGLLEKRYNHTFNDYKPRTHKGKAYYPGMSSEWQQQLHPFQREAIQRIISEGTTLLAHEVGFGKTASMVGSAMERQRMGLTEKPMFVIPKATHAQFTQDYLDLYPGARILSPDQGEFSTSNRERFLSRIATSDWDAVIVTGEQFQSIPLSPKQERAFVDGEKAQLQASLETLEKDDSEDRAEGKRSKSQKEVEVALAALDKKLKDRLAKIERADAIYFDQLGVDMLYVDEADRYKNLAFRTGMGGRGQSIKGMPSGESGRAMDMYTKIRYLQGKPNPGQVVFATGTPISNTLAEAWTMMRYLNEPELRRQGLHHFDAWAKTFGNMAEDMELDAAGRYKMTKRFRDFVNKPELAKMFQEIADIRVISETPTMQALRPKLAGGERNIVTSPRDPQLDNYMKVLVKRAENLPYPPKPGDDNMLKVLTDGRKASMDLRLVGDDEGYAEMFDAPVGAAAKPYTDGKLIQVARNVARINKMETPLKGAQLVFLDMGTPKGVVKGDDAQKERGEDELAAAESAIETGLYRILKERMVDHGVPEDKIAFIHDYKTDEQREELFETVRKGDIRVLIGSTEKMGVGVNVQERAAALHHVDAPWRPRDIEQREGRIVRQKNKVYGPILDKDKNPIDPGRGVQVYQYVQKGGMDEFMWQMLEEKGRGIKGIMRRHIDPGERRVKDIDSLVISAADTKAAAAANPLVKRNVELGHSIQQLMSDRKAHQLRVKSAQKEIGGAQRSIETYSEVLPRMEQDAAYVKGLPKDAKFKAELRGQTFSKARKAGEVLAEAVRHLPQVRTDEAATSLGSIKGFDIVGRRLESGYEVRVSRPETGQPYTLHYASRDELIPDNMIRRLNMQIAAIPQRVTTLQEKLGSSRNRLGVAERESGEQWGKGDELRALETEQGTIRQRLQAGETGEEDDVVYGLKPLALAPWETKDIDAVNRQLQGEFPEGEQPRTGAEAKPADPPAGTRREYKSEADLEQEADENAETARLSIAATDTPEPEPTALSEAPVAVLSEAAIADQMGTGYDSPEEKPTDPAVHQAGGADIIERANKRAQERVRKRKEAVGLVRALTGAGRGMERIQQETASATEDKPDSAAEMLAQATEGPVKLTGAGSVMERIQQETASATEVSTPPAMPKTPRAARPKTKRKTSGRKKTGKPIGKGKASPISGKDKVRPIREPKRKETKAKKPSYDEDGKRRRQFSLDNPVLWV